MGFSPCHLDLLQIAAGAYTRICAGRLADTDPSAGPFRTGPAGRQRPQMPRLPKDVHCDMAIRAAEERVSINLYLLSRIAIDAPIPRPRRTPRNRPCQCVDRSGALARGYLKSLGHKAPKSAVSEYLEWFEDAYVLFTALRRLRPEIFYQKTRTGRQVDFIVPTRGRKTMLVQICESRPIHGRDDGRRQRSTKRWWSLAWIPGPS